jgi:hypothetical protein
MIEQILAQKTEVFQGVDMCKGESQSVVTIRIDGEEINLYGQFAAHYDMLLRNRADQAKRIEYLEASLALYEVPFKFKPIKEANQ